MRVEENESEIYQDYEEETKINSNENKSSNKIKSRDIARKLSSFDHFIYVWGVKAGYYIPPKSSLTWQFISEVICGKKKLIKASIIGVPLNIPKFKGILVKNHYEQYANINNLYMYFPNITDGVSVPRDYFYNVS